jgi:hypothetical protein
MTDIGFPPVWSSFAQRFAASCLFDKYLLGESVVRQSSFVNDNTLPRRFFEPAVRGMAASVKGKKHVDIHDCDIECGEDLR